MNKLEVKKSRFNNRDIVFINENYWKKDYIPEWIEYLGILNIPLCIVNDKLTFFNEVRVLYYDEMKISHVLNIPEIMLYNKLELMLSTNYKQK